MFDNPYKFYEQSYKQCEALIGQWWTEERRDGTSYYFPIRLTVEEGRKNYGHRYGLLTVIPILKERTPPYSKWWRVAVFSPDDWDLDLNFGAEHTKIRWDVIDFIKKMPKRNVTYLQCLKAIRDHFKAGQIDNNGHIEL